MKLQKYDLSIRFNNQVQFSRSRMKSNIVAQISGVGITVNTKVYGFF